MRVVKKQTSDRSHIHRPVTRNRRALIRHQHEQGRDIRWLAWQHCCTERTISETVNNKFYDDLEEDAKYLDSLDIPDDEDNCSQVGEEASRLTLTGNDEHGESSMTAQNHGARKARCRAPSPGSILSGSGIYSVRVTSQLQLSPAKTSTCNDPVRTFLKDLGLGANAYYKRFLRLGIRTAADLRALKDLSVENGDMVRAELLEAKFSHLQYMRVVAALLRLY